jgi:hypothetical protein
MISVRSSCAAAGDSSALSLATMLINHDEQITIATPCTLRATRQGPGVVGKP